MSQDGKATQAVRHDVPATGMSGQNWLGNIDGRRYFAKMHKGKLNDTRAQKAPRLAAGDFTAVWNDRAARKSVRRATSAASEATYNHSPRNQANTSQPLHIVVAAGICKR